MLDIKTISEDITAGLKPLNPLMVVLFGSYAYGAPTDESDVDIYVVLNDDYIPENFSQKQEIFLRVSRSLRHLRMMFPIDLVVHTKAMYHKFIEVESSFSRDILSKGIQLYAQ